MTVLNISSLDDCGTYIVIHDVNVVTCLPSSRTNSVQTES